MNLSWENGMYQAQAGLEVICIHLTQKGAYDTGGSHSGKISCILQRIQAKRKWWEAQPQRYSIWENLSLVGYSMRPSKLWFECTSCREDVYSFAINYEILDLFH